VESCVVRWPRAITIGALAAPSVACAQGAKSELVLLVERTSASVRFDPVSSSNQARQAHAAAVGVAFAGHGRLGARVELSVVQKGFNRTEPTAHWTYVELPVLGEARFRIPTARLQPIILAGVAPAVALTCSVAYDGVAGAYHGSCFAKDPLELVHPASHWDIGATIGTGLRVRLGSGWLLVEGRHTRGLHHVERTTTHRVWMAGLGAAVPLGP